MDKEHWRQITNHPRYYVSNHGRVKSIINGKEKELKQRDDRYGYPRVTLSEKRK